MITNNINAPHNYPAAILPEVQEIDERGINLVLEYKTLEFEKQCSAIDKLSLKEAELVIQKVCAEKVVKYLTHVNVFFVDVVKLIKKLKENKKILEFSGLLGINNGKKLVYEEVKASVVFDLLTVEVHRLFKALRNYTGIYEGETRKANKLTIIEAQEVYYKIYNLFLKIEGIVKKTCVAKEYCNKFKVYCEVLYHLCHNEDFLNKYSQSQSPLEIEDSVMFFPPQLANMELYLDSLDVCLYSLSQCQSKIEIDYKDPLLKAIQQINKMPKSCFGNLGLADFVISIKDFMASLETFNKGFPLSVQNIALKLIENPCNTPLTACFEKLKDSGCSLVTIYDTMIPLVEEIATPLESHTKNHEILLEQGKTEVISAFAQFNKAIIALGSAVSKAKIPTKNRTQLNKLVTALNKISLIEPFGDLFVALIDQSVRIPMCTFQEMQLFFKIIKVYNENAKAFHKTLIKEGGDLPCSSFNQLDLWILQVFEHINEGGQGGTLREVVNELFPKIFKRWNWLQTESILVKSSDEINENFLQEIFETLKTIVYSLYKACDELGLENSSLKETTVKLDQYFKVFKNYPILRVHAGATLMHPCSTQHEISAPDLPLIRQMFDMLAYQIETKYIRQNIDNLVKEVEKKLSLATEEGKFFWKLNLKYASLAKLAILKLMQIVHSCHQELKSAETIKDHLTILHEFKKKMVPIENSYNSWAFQVSLIGAFAEQNNDVELYMLCSGVAEWSVCFNHQMETINEIVSLNKLPKNHSLKVKQIAVEEVSTEDSSDEEELIETPLSIKAETYQEQPYEGMLTLLNTLSASELPRQTLSAKESYIFCSTERDKMIKNSCFYLALLEEAKEWNQGDNHALLKKRAQLNSMLLLEATEKMALPYSVEGFSSFHSLIFTHKGEELVSKVNQAWFSHQSIKSAIQYQETLLKKAYWFKDDIQIINGISEIVPCCENVWKHLAVMNSSLESAFSTQVKDFQACIFHLNKLKYPKLQSFTLPLSETDPEKLFSQIGALKNGLDVNPECLDIAKEHSKAIVRAVDFCQALGEFKDNGKMPLFFALCSADIQVSLLSSALILALSTVQSDDHPLLKEDQERPLAYSHRVDKIWNVLKENINHKDFIDTYISAFVGDPRYPLSSQKPLSFDLVKMYERVYLLQKIALGGWFKDEDKKLLQKHIGKGFRLYTLQEQKDILEKKIAKGIAEVQKKTLLALQLTTAILDLNFK